MAPHPIEENPSAEHRAGSFVDETRFIELSENEVHPRPFKKSQPVARCYIIGRARSSNFNSDTPAIIRKSSSKVTSFAPWWSATAAMSRSREPTLWPCCRHAWPSADAEAQRSGGVERTGKVSNWRVRSSLSCGVA